MIEQKTFKVKISREFSYEYEVKANNEDDAIDKAFDDWEGETDDVELIEEECYRADCMESEEVKNDWQSTRTANFRELWQSLY